jgi:hypothetical protein
MNIRRDLRLLSIKPFAGESEEESKKVLKEAEKEDRSES